METKPQQPETSPQQRTREQFQTLGSQALKELSPEDQARMQDILADVEQFGEDKNHLSPRTYLAENIATTLDLPTETIDAIFAEADETLESHRENIQETTDKIHLLNRTIHVHKPSHFFFAKFHKKFFARRVCKHHSFQIDRSQICLIL